MKGSGLWVKGAGGLEGSYEDMGQAASHCSRLPR